MSGSSRHISIAEDEYNKMLQKLQTLEIEKNRLAREVRTLNKRIEANQLSFHTQLELGKILTAENLKQTIYIRLLLDACPDPMFIFDENLIFLLGSKSIAEIIDVGDVCFLQGKKLDDIVTTYRPPALTDTLTRLIKSVAFDRSHWCAHSKIEISTENKKYEVKILPFHKNNDDFSGILLIMHDATDLVKEKELAKQASHAKSDFLAKMSHEIRTPMNAILSMAELALRASDPDIMKEYALTTKQACANLLVIINDILDLSKIEAGKLEITSAEYLTPSLIHDVVSVIKMRALDSPIRFTVDTDCNIPHTLVGDEVKIRQVLINILGNAVKYTEKGFVSFIARGEFVDDDTVNLVMEVRDSGQGIKQEALATLFDEFTQFSRENSPETEGVGLGLAITRSIVEAMGGSISVTSEYGKGSTFTVVLPQRYHSREPLAAVENPQDKSILLFYERREAYGNSLLSAVKSLGVRYTLLSRDDDLHEHLSRQEYDFIFVPYHLFRKSMDILAQYKKNAKIVVMSDFGEITTEVFPDNSISMLAMPIYSIPVANILNGKFERHVYNIGDSVVRFSAPGAKVLVVDDINTNLKVAQGLLAPYNMQVDICNSGKAAIEAVQSERYDLVFMDHKMPGMDGVEATRRIRELGQGMDGDPYYTALPVVALTANAISGTREMFLANGLNDFISKPIDTIMLNSILERWIPKDKQEAVRLAEKNGNTAAAIKIDGLDTRKGIALSGESTNNYLATLAVFHADSLERIKTINACLETDDLVLYTTVVHALKSASATIGASALSEAASALELAGERKDLAFIKKHHPGFIQSLERLLVNIQDRLQAVKTRGVPFDIKVMKSRLADLKAAIDTLDGDAMDNAVEYLLTTAPPSENARAAIRKLSDSVLTGEYDKAQTLIEELLRQYVSDT